MAHPPQDDAPALLRVPSHGAATAATGAFSGPVSIDPGNLLVTDTAGPPPDALQVRCSATLRARTRNEQGARDK